MKQYRNNSGCIGVHWNKNKSVWVSKITYKRHSLFLGSYQSFDEAVRSRRMSEYMISMFKNLEATNIQVLERSDKYISFRLIISENEVDITIYRQKNVNATVEEV